MYFEYFEMMIATRKILFLNITITIFLQNDQIYVRIVHDLKKDHNAFTVLQFEIIFEDKLLFLL